MTALCGGGASAPQFGTAAVTDITTTAIGLMLEEASGGWLIPVVAFLSIAPLVLSTYCGTDPPAQPTFTTAERDALLNVTLGADFASGLVKFQNLILNLAWPRLCQCSSAVTPAAPALNAPPSGTPFPIAVSPAGQKRCGIEGNSVTAAIGSLGGNAAAWLFSTYPTSQFFRVHYIRTAVGAGPHDDSTLTIFWGDNSGPVRNDTVATWQPDGIWHTIDLVNAPGFLSVAQVGINTTHLSTDTWGAYAEIFCGPPGSASTCCGPDPTTVNMLRILLDQVNLLQRYMVPLNYKLGTVHAGLTGSATLAVASLLGVKVELTAFPGTNRTGAGNPTYLYDMGWLSIGDPDGMLDEKRVARAAFTWLPRDMSMATSINYDFFAGVTATITELEPADA